MSEQQNIKLTQDAYAAFGRKDITALLGYMSDDIDWQTFGPKELPMGGQRRSKPEVQKFFATVEEVWNFDRFEPREFIAQGDNVVSLGSYTGNAKKSGGKFDAQFSHVFTIKNGKIVKFREYTDTANLLAAIAGSKISV